MGSHLFSNVLGYSVYTCIMCLRNFIENPVLINFNVMYFTELTNAAGSLLRKYYNLIIIFQYFPYTVFPDFLKAKLGMKTLNMLIVNY